MIGAATKKRGEQDTRSDSSSLETPKSFEPRLRNFDSLVSAEFGATRRREIVLIPEENEITSALDVERSVRRAGFHGVVDFAPGQYEGCFLDSSAELVCKDSGSASFVGACQVSAPMIYIRGLRFEAGDSTFAIQVEKGVLLLEDCDVYGAVEVQKGAKLLAKNCSFTNKKDLLVGHLEASIELIACKVVSSEVGVVLEKVSDAAFYSCRFQKLHGAASMHLRSNGSPVYLQGCEFFDGTRALELDQFSVVQIGSCFFARNIEEAICGKAANNDALLRIAGCEFKSASFAPTLRVRGGRMELFHVRIKSPSECILAEACEIFTKEVNFETEVLNQVRLLDGSNWKDLEDTTIDNQTNTNAATNELLDKAVGHIHRIVGQNTVKNNLRRVVQQAWAIKQRGGVVSRSMVSVSFLGVPDRGQQHVARHFADALTVIGVLRSQFLHQLSAESLVARVPIRDVGAGIFYLDLSAESDRELGDFEVELFQFLQTLPERTAFVLAGEAERVRSIFRNYPELHRVIPHEVTFLDLQPSDLAEYFKLYCEEEKISLTPESVKKLLIVIHTFHDGFGRQLTDLEGIHEFFLTVRQNYLSRCAASGKLDLAIEPDDIPFSVHHRARALWNRSPEFLAICPNCGAENPWLPQLAKHIHCLSCGAAMPCDWGILKDSSQFKKIQSRTEGIRSGAVAQRRRTGPKS